MIKKTVITLAFGATLVEKHPQPDIPHKNYWTIPESCNTVHVYGNMQVGQIANNTTECNFVAVLATKLI